MGCVRVLGWGRDGNNGYGGLVPVVVVLVLALIRASSCHGDAVRLYKKSDYNS